MAEQRGSGPKVRHRSNWGHDTLREDGHQRMIFSVVLYGPDATRPRTRDALGLRKTADKSLFSDRDEGSHDFKSAIRTMAYAERQPIGIL